jgi:hypothetical protein
VCEYNIYHNARAATILKWGPLKLRLAATTRALQPYSR